MAGWSKLNSQSTGNLNKVGSNNSNSNPSKEIRSPPVTPPTWKSPNLSAKAKPVNSNGTVPLFKQRQQQNNNSQNSKSQNFNQNRNQHNQHQMNQFHTPSPNQMNSINMSPYGNQQMMSGNMGYVNNANNMMMNQNNFAYTNQRMQYQNGWYR